MVRLALIQLQDHVWDNMTHPHGPEFRTAGSRPDTDPAAVGQEQGPEKQRPRLPAAPNAPATSDVLTHALPGATCPGHVRHVAPLVRKLPRGFPGTSRHCPLQRRRQSARGRVRSRTSGQWPQGLEASFTPAVPRQLTDRYPGSTVTPSLSNLLV